MLQKGSAPIFQIQHGDSFRRISVGKLTDGTQNIKYHLLTIRSISALLISGIALNLRTLHTPQGNNHNRLGIDRKAN